MPRKSKKTTPWKKKIDLHGLQVDEALAKLDRLINQCILDHEVHEVEIIHGIGTGKIKKAVHEYLESINDIDRLIFDPQNPGVTRIFFA